MASFEESKHSAITDGIGITSWDVNDPESYPGEIAENILMHRELFQWATSDHSNLVPITCIDFDDEKGRLGIVQRHIEGVNLERFNNRHSFSLTETVNLLQGLFSGVSHLHRRGLVHRDISPSNIILSEKEPRRLLLHDYEIALPIGTRNGSLSAGTEGFCPIEQYSQGPDSSYVLPTQDIYALGRTLMSFLGKNVFALKGIPSYLSDADSAESINLLRQSIEARYSEDVFKVLLKATSRFAEDRYHTAEQFWTEMKRSLTAPECIMKALDRGETFEDEFLADKIKPLQEYAYTYFVQKVDNWKRAVAEGVDVDVDVQQILLILAMQRLDFINDLERKNRQ